MGELMADYSQIKQILSEQPNSKEEAIERDRLERSITSYREEQLLKNPIQGDYDFEHLSKIHHYLFDGLRDYAGKLRQIEPFYKQNDYEPSLITIFANKDEILPTIHETSEFLKQNNYLKDLSKEDFIYEFTVSYAEFNFAHPFEEGNGRATRVFFKQLAQEAGYEFNTSKINTKQWVMASTLSCEHGTLYDLGDGVFDIEPSDERDIDKLIDVMNQCLEPIQLDYQTELEKLKSQLTKDNIKKDYPTISDNDAKTIELFVNYQLSQHQNPKAQQAILEKIQSQLPDIASRKIILPDLPTQDKDKGGR